MEERLRYGNWIRVRKIFLFWAVTLFFLSASLLAMVTPWFLLLLVPAFVFAYVGVIVTLTHRRFSSRGGNYQNKIHDLLLSYKATPGDTIDIGCGNGNFIIKVAKGDRAAAHFGCDYWGENWEYSLRQCQINARIEGVENVAFSKEDANKISLDDGRYAYVFSCLTFHEVRDQPDKSQLLNEALRILRPGGTYVFLDLFDDKKHYPRLDDILDTIGISGCSVCENRPLRELMVLPFPLNDRNALRYARLLSGTKSIAP